MRKVNKPVIDEFIKQRITEILGFEDEVVVGLVQNTLDEQVRACPLLLLSLAYIDPVGIPLYYTQQYMRSYLYMLSPSCWYSRLVEPWAVLCVDR